MQLNFIYSKLFHSKMSNDLLPEWLNLFLDDLETTLCLPILVVIVLCTAQFIFNHALDIGYTFYQNIKQKGDADEDENEKGGDMMTKLKGMVCNLIGSKTADVKIEGNSQEEWDYCEEDDN